jgi:hypothetical protein
MNNSIKKELEAAKIAADKCMDEKCSNSPKFKKFTDAIKMCNEKYKDYPQDKNSNKFLKIIECQKSYKVTPKIMMQLGECNDINCKDKIDKIKEISKKKMYSEFPEVTEIDQKIKQLEEEKQKCQETHCSHIYPLDKLKKENDECMKVIIDLKKYKKCVDKYKIYEKNNKMNKCAKKSCKKIMKQINNLHLKKFKIISKKNNKSQHL